MLDPGEIQIVHTISRCVRRSFLCGDDPYSGESYEHRRQWIRDRLEFLSGIFGIDCLPARCGRHVERSRCARRWLRLFPPRREPNGSPAEPTPAEIDAIVNQADVLAQRRRRLSDVSWWMKCTTEAIARRANREDRCTGHFWEGRYRCVLLPDEAALLACAAYVDLNPIRAALAETPETSAFTGAKERMDDLAAESAAGKSTRHQRARIAAGERSGWLKPAAVRCRARSDGSGRLRQRPAGEPQRIPALFAGVVSGAIGLDRASASER
jgi:hypothetical protein